MWKRRVMLAGMIGLVVLVLSNSATAAGKSKHRITATNRIAIIEQGQGFPGIDTTAVLAGVLESKADGGKARRGSSEVHVTITGGDLAAGLEYQGDELWYFRRGSIEFSDVGEVTLQSDGSLIYAGRFKVTGGTGAFRGATGTMTYTGSSPMALGVATLEYEGTISY